jgi:hypothetical protein
MQNKFKYLGTFKTLGIIEMREDKVGHASNIDVWLAVALQKFIVVNAWQLGSLLSMENFWIIGVIYVFER